ncbi:hypothetical protein PIB30_069018 [Stylosanthes scabra]|uniref:Uncharacterized protein n=1 Tax=Stylosanthes scabra TaxID=79078 RepID=A0ABU6ZLP1_9FABA|nr:hypothetical protein [Stylosanthes scabra]
MTSKTHSYPSPKPQQTQQTQPSPQNRKENRSEEATRYPMPGAAMKHGSQPPLRKLPIVNPVRPWSSSLKIAVTTESETDITDEEIAGYKHRVAELAPSLLTMLQASNQSPTASNSAQTACLERWLPIKTDSRFSHKTPAAFCQKPVKNQHQKN